MGLFFSHMGLFCRHNLSPTSSTRFVVCDYCRVTWSEDIIIEGTRRRYNYIYRCVYIYIERERERERERYVACPQVSVLYAYIRIYIYIRFMSAKESWISELEPNISICDYMWLFYMWQRYWGSFGQENHTYPYIKELTCLSI